MLMNDDITAHEIDEPEYIRKKRLFNKIYVEDSNTFYIQKCI